jgi:predicted trehalose synthase
MGKENGATPSKAVEAIAVQTWRVNRIRTCTELEPADQYRSSRACAGQSGTGMLMTRIHGDFHLGQVLVASGDAHIIDFEGEPATS